MTQADKLRWAEAYAESQTADVLVKLYAEIVEIVLQKYDDELSSLRDDMRVEVRAEALARLAKMGVKFNPTKSNRPYEYFYVLASSAVINALCREKKRLAKEATVKQTSAGPMLLGCAYNAADVYAELLSLGFVDLSASSMLATDVILPKRNARGKIIGVYASGKAGDAWMKQPGRFAHITRTVPVALRGNSRS